jgi:hypothetical protein
MQLRTRRFPAKEVFMSAIHELAEDHRSDSART